MLACGVVFASCDMVNGDFLDEPARGAVSEEVLAEQAGGVEALMIGAYGALTAVAENGAALGGGSAWEGAQDNHIYGSIAGGEAYRGSEPGDQAPMLRIAKMLHDPSSGYFGTKWNTLFEGISRANSVLSLLEEGERTQLRAEARFLRGHFYFDLKRNFGRVPWIDENTEDLKQPNTGPDAADVWTKIEEDFQFAKDNLPDRGSKGDIGRADRWAAQAYLGKTHLYQEEWSDALSELEGVINSGPYSLTGQYQDMFNPATENNSGSVFAVQNTGDDGSGGIGNSRGGSVLNYPHGGDSPFICCGFYQPSQWLVNSFRVDGNGHPIPDRASGNHVKNDWEDYPTPSDSTYTLGTQTLDPRLEWTVGRRGVPYHDWGPHPGRVWIRHADGGPYAPKKHVYRRAQRDEFGASNAWGATGSGVNYEVIRYADVLLMAAEAAAHEGRLNDGDRGLSYVNMVRNRAQDSEVTNDMNEAFAVAVVDNQADMLAIDEEDLNRNGLSWVVRTDRNSTFAYLGHPDSPDQDDPSDISQWQEYQLPDYDVQPYSGFSSQAEALEKIRFERMLELGMEGHRFYDLARWGTAADELGAYYEFETSSNGGYVKENLNGANFEPDKNEVYPIPQRQIDLNVVEGETVLEQNCGYAGANC